MKLETLFDRLSDRQSVEPNLRITLPDPEIDGDERDDLMTVSDPGFVDPLVILIPIDDQRVRLVSSVVENLLLVPAEPGEVLSCELRDQDSSLFSVSQLEDDQLLADPSPFGRS